MTSTNLDPEGGKSPRLRSTNRPPSEATWSAREVLAGAREPMRRLRTSVRGAPRRRRVPASEQANRTGTHGPRTRTRSIPLAATERLWLSGSVGLLRNSLLVAAASAASGTVAYQAASSYQAKAQGLATTATDQANQARSKAGAFASAAGANAGAAGAKLAEAKSAAEAKLAEGLAAAKDLAEPESLVLTLQKRGFSQQGSKLTLIFTIDKKVKGGDAQEGVTAEEVQLLEDDEEVSPDEGWRRFTSEFRDVRVNHRMLLDLSGSMTSEAQLQALARSGAHYVDKIFSTKDSGNHFVAIDGFDGGPVIPIVAYTQDAVELKRALSNPCVNELCKDPSTNLNGALEAELAQLEADADAEKSLVESAILLFTDGIDQAGTNDTKALLEKNAESGVHAYMIAVGTKGDPELLGKFGKSGVFPYEDPKGMTKAAGALAERTPALAKHFYRVEYCSPKRGGSHKLKLKIRHKDEQKVMQLGSLMQEFELGDDKFECDLPRPKR